MNEETFVERKEAEWNRLQELTDRATVSPAKLTGVELRELVRLYRRSSTDLSMLRSRSTNQALVDYLNDLNGRTYAALYQEPRNSVRKMVMNAIERAAQTVRRRRVFVFLSLAIFLFSACFSFGLLHFLPQTREALLPGDSSELFSTWKSGQFPDRTSDTNAAMTGFYISNNPRVAIISGAVGAGSFGFLSVFMNYQNGALIGTLGHEMFTVGKLGFLLGSIFPHGVPEISGLLISCSAGLLLGWSLISPGRRSRGEALKEVGGDAIVLLATSVVLMFIAAPIEGFFSFNPLVPIGVKVGVGVVEVFAWLAVWAYVGQTATPTEIRSSEAKR